MGVDIKSLPKPVRAFFNGVGQVVFIENVICGALFLISFLVAGLEMHGWDFGNWYSWRPFVFTIIGVNIANGVAYLMGADRDAITSGLFGFCPNLIAIGACTFTSGADAQGDWWSAWIMLILGCALCPPLQIMINRFTGHFNLPGFTFPFIVMVWFFTAMSFQTDLLHVGNVPGVVSPAGIVDTPELGRSWMTGFDWSQMGWEWGAMNPTHWGLFFINAFEEIYVLDGFIASLIMIFAYFWYNFQFGIKALIATAFAIGMGLIFGAGMMPQMGLSLYGYSSILTVGALDTFALGTTRKNSGRYWFLFFLGLTLTSLINFAVPTVLGCFGMPSCTIAFVVAGWIMLVVEHFMVEQAEKRAAAKNSNS